MKARKVWFATGIIITENIDVSTGSIEELTTVVAWSSFSLQNIRIKQGKGGIRVSSALAHLPFVAGRACRRGRQQHPMVCAAILLCPSWLTTPSCRS